MNRALGTLLALVFLSVLLLLGCVAAPPSPAEAQMEQARLAVIALKGADIQSCRDRGGVPVTKQAAESWTSEYRQELARCEFPCGAR